MGIPTLIGSTHTASGAALLAITSGIDGTYDEYMFLILNFNPADSGGKNLTFQGSTDGGSSYGVTTTTTVFTSEHSLDGSDGGSVSYTGGSDIGSGTGEITLMYGVGNGAMDSASGTLNLFSPSNTTYVKHFYSRVEGADITAGSPSLMQGVYGGGYFNTASDAINAIRFSCSSGNMDLIVQMFGIA